MKKHWRVELVGGPLDGHIHESLAAMVPARIGFPLMCWYDIKGDKAEYANREHDESKPVQHRPRVVTLCGSTRFMDEFHAEGWRLTLEGVIVLTVGVVKTQAHHAGEALGPDVARRLDELHLRKIDMSDAVRVVNPGDYVGESTSKEIGYAYAQGKPVTFMFPSDKCKHERRGYPDGNGGYFCPNCGKDNIR